MWRCRLQRRLDHDDSGTTPDNDTDVDVTDTVGDHCAYIKPAVGCVPQMVEDFESQ
ncbi:hypothetical protein [Haloterrigena salifodinae]|uniref:hypothetical protein n=1 Tax=Haloterrigena salifodinae TaxID=2675099 RepID=UPI0020132371|nr:hypothetical protein [Haloterrigena salifodinae]